MKFLKIFMAFLVLSVYAIADDKSENKEVMTNLYEKVIVKDIDRTINSLKSLKSSIKNKDLIETKQNLKELIKSWKSTETLYVLGDLNDDFIDTPRLIDIFHNGNEDITKQLDRAIASKDKIKIVLFKNSLKSINALEYVLLEKNIKKQRVNEIALAIVDRIAMHVNNIKKEYELKKAIFINDLKKSNALVINALIQSSYKLKEWRVGDVVGISKKYKGKADNKRAEYYLSKNSANAIKAILNTYKNVLNNPSFNDFGDYLEKLDASGLKELRKSIDKSIELVNKIKNDDFFNQQKLFEELNKIHVILFVEMVEDLSINAKILDADGD